VEKMIRVEKLWFTYDNKTYVFEDLDLEITAGLNLLRGPNGSGKTTFSKIISGLLPPTRGSVYIDGIDIYREDDMSRDKLREVVYVHDKPILLRGTLYENLLFGADVMGINIDETRLNSLIKYFEVDGILDKKRDEASAGERQIISFIRAIVVNPRYLILDEPFQYLDDNRRKRVREYLIKLSDSGTTILISTHEKAMLEDADHIYYITNGKIDLLK
jgi:ABC-type multidrug transport system ATPase subunit